MFRGDKQDRRGSSLKRILWCITGAGGYLRRLFQKFLDLRSAYPGLELGIAISRAGEEVARIYGVLDNLEKIVSGGRYGGLYRDSSWSGITEDGVPLGGRISLRRYDVVIVAPATSNTVAKIAHGIADTLPTIAASQALKSEVPLLILPADCAESSLTTLPCFIDEQRCTCCLLCVDACPFEAIRLFSKNAVRIDYNECRGCGRCENACPAGAIRCWEETRITPSSIDLENIAKLRRVRGLHVLESPEELIEKLKSLLKI
ncbi:4Fe-4S dicluster domain-containing protein [Candidatus Bathyarchaeota archaeon]|nr:MAG: 4Fe-4S dicluster domain-containing protein [Candidatus Bathyarchaeota archaeon]